MAGDAARGLSSTLQAAKAPPVACDELRGFLIYSFATTQYQDVKNQDYPDRISQGNNASYLSRGWLSGSILMSIFAPVITFGMRQS